MDTDVWEHVADFARCADSDAGQQTWTQRRRTLHTNDNTLLRFNTTTDSVAWQVAGAFPSTPAYDAGVLYVANEKPFRLEARAESDGAVLRSWTPPAGAGTAFMSEVLLTSNLIFISTASM